MKTNHQRNFKDTRDSRSVYNNYVVFECLVKMQLSDHIVSAGVNCGDHTNGKRGIARDRRGAKKYIRSRTRFHENAATKRMIYAI